MKQHTNKQTIFVGDVFNTNCHGDIEVIYYNHANDIGVRFEDGYERSTTSGNIRKGKVKNPTMPVKTHAKREDGDAIVMGKEYTNNAGHKFVVKGYVNASNVLIEFESGFIATVTSQHIRKGSTWDKLSPERYGVGVFGVGKYDSDGLEYKYWTTMLTRAYDDKYKERYPTYSGVSVCTEWHNFQVFAEWCNTKAEFKDGMNLDKDILVKGNKVYSPTTCTFVPHKINALFVKADASRGDTPIGVYFATKNSKYGACLRKDGKNHHLGFFTSTLPAFLAYKKAKEAYIKEMAEKFKHEIELRCYNALLAYEVEITD